MLGKNGKPPSKQFLEAMPYTQSLLASGLAVGYHAKAAPPTVTMPRLKVWSFIHVLKGKYYIHPSNYISRSPAYQDSVRSLQNSPDQTFHLFEKVIVIKMWIHIC